MKKNLIHTLIAAILISSLSSCATIFGGPVTEAQRTKPLPGEPTRSIRPVALIADIVIFLPSLIVDFATNAIYKPVQPNAAAETPKADAAAQPAKTN